MERKCKYHPAYPALCITHFEEDEKDHPFVLCDKGLEELMKSPFDKLRGQVDEIVSRRKCD